MAVFHIYKKAKSCRKILTEKQLLLYNKNEVMTDA